jgi:glycosyltransferase involved in cell wall biosynthesis
MMRIAYVTTDPGIAPDGVKGASIHVRAILSALLRQGAEVTLFAPEADARPLQGFEEVKRIGLPRPPKGCAETRADALIVANAALEETLAAAGPFDLVYERHALFSDAAMRFGRAHGIQTLLEVNAPLLDEQLAHRTLVREREARQLTASAMSCASRVIAVSPAVEAYARAHGAASTRVVPNGVDAARFRTPPRFRAPFTMGFVGTLKPWHDVACLIDALGHLRHTVPDVRLLIVGDGPERAKLEAQAQALQVMDAVEFVGTVTADAVPGFLERMHVGLAPYRGGDPFYFSPLKVYEYMAAALPVIASDVGGLGDILLPPRAGTVVPPDDPASLANAVAALARDPSIGRRQGRRGRAHVIETARWDQVLLRSLEGMADLPMVAA